jgi:hypothetical protein
LTYSGICPHSHFTMTYSEAVAKARRLAKKNDREYFVVRECGQIDVCSAEDLDSSYCGIAEHNILFSTFSD